MRLRCVVENSIFNSTVEEEDDGGDKELSLLVGTILQNYFRTKLKPPVATRLAAAISANLG